MVKTKDLRAMTNDQLEEKLVANKKEQFNLRICRDYFRNIDCHKNNFYIDYDAGVSSCFGQAKASWNVSCREAL